MITIRPDELGAALTMQRPDDDPLLVVDLDGADAVAPPAPALFATAPAVVLGRASDAVPGHLLDFARALSCTLAPIATDRCVVAEPEPDSTLAIIDPEVGTRPTAALVLQSVLRLTAGLDVPDALVAESLAYSTLLAGPEFRRWLAHRPVLAPVPHVADPVLLTTDGDTLRVTLNRPERRNALGRQVRDGLLAAFDLADADPSVGRVLLDGAGPSFCSGGDLAEFGTAPDVATAHVVRLAGGVAARIHRSRATVEAYVHGACLGAGVELPAFAASVTAHRETRFRLPELGMGLVPGAGGTVGIARRIGRWRTAYLALSGAWLDSATAQRWGLVDVLDG